MNGRERAAVIGVDIGTSKIAAVVVELPSGRTLGVVRKPNDAAIACTERDYAEQQPDRIRQRSFACLRGAAAVARRRACRILAVGITGQMHGMVPVDAAGNPTGPLVTWQDRRCLERFRATRRTFIDEMVRRAGGERAFHGAGCFPATGYLGATLFWMRERRRLPRGTVQVGFISGYIAAQLTGARRLCADATDAAGSGVFDVARGGWDAAVLRALGIPEELLPELRSCGSVIGEVNGAAARATGLPRGTPICCPLGDNQASIIGAGGDPARTVYVNIGTGGQVSVVVQCFLRVPGMDARPFPGGRFALVGATCTAGYAYVLLERFFRETGRVFFGVRVDAPLFARMNALAAAAPPEVVCEPLFCGTREHPSAAAVFRGITAASFTPGGFARAVLEGIADELFKRYGALSPQARARRSTLIASGNAVRRNPLLVRILAARFGMQVMVSPYQEEAARGAALQAAGCVRMTSDFSKKGIKNP